MSESSKEEVSLQSLLEKDSLTTEEQYQLELVLVKHHSALVDKRYEKLRKKIAGAEVKNFKDYAITAIGSVIVVGVCLLLLEDTMPNLNGTGITKDNWLAIIPFLGASGVIVLSIFAIIYSILGYREDREYERYSHWFVMQLQAFEVVSTPLKTQRSDNKDEGLKSKQDELREKLIQKMFGNSQDVSGLKKR